MFPVKKSIMPKYTLKARKRQLCVIILLILNLKAGIHFYKLYGKLHYSHTPAWAIQGQLYKQVAANLVLQKSKPDCKYDEILKSTSSLLNWEVPRKYDDFSAKGLVNGSYVPEHCNPLFSVALIVAYRNRQSQLQIFLPYIHNFLRKQNIHYRIYVIEQQDKKIFNKGILLNVGAKTAIKDKFPCLILHDVDLLPLDESNLYACTHYPRHMSASIDKFRFSLPYEKLVGGALAITSKQFVAVDGLSNRFEGWGGEDDDLANRLSAHHFVLIRFPRKMSRYTMVVHPQEPMNSVAQRIVRENQLHGGKDGLSTLPNVTTHVKNNRQFTLVGVQPCDSVTVSP